MHKFTTIITIISIAGLIVAIIFGPVFIKALAGVGLCSSLLFVPEAIAGRKGRVK